MEHLPCSIYGVVVLSYLALQLLFAELEHRRHRRASAGPGGCPAVTVVPPTYNQPGESLRACIESVWTQDYPGEILLLVVDDGSRDPPTRESCGIAGFGAPVAILPEGEVPAEPDSWGNGSAGASPSGFARCHPSAIATDGFGGPRRRGDLICLPCNAGKRRAQRAAFDRAEGKYVVSLDDDTTLAPHALSRLVALMECDDRVGAATGSIRVRNRTSLFTTLLDLRYWAACHLERAAQSYFGVMVCCSGAIAIYRRDLIERLKDEYVAQRFLGRECTYGDDRHLTNLVLREGYDARFVPDAGALTACPESVGRWLRQQRRWSKSFYRECWWSLQFAHRRNVYFGYNLVVGALLPFLLAYGLVAAGMHVASGHWWTAGRYLATIVAMGWVRGACGLLMTRDPAFLLMPLYGFLHLALVFPVRLIALFTLWDTRWGTR